MSQSQAVGATGISGISERSEIKVLSKTIAFSQLNANTKLHGQRLNTYLKKIKNNYFQIRCFLFPTPFAKN
ncbi:hypothetical protein LYNGBM3L_07520 [Moorena producens 3L]|uniref:Uncharacterized protein n=1 Tax=Moorena producens 3L TaxID=489825 RepID=F4XJC2_9CYAN|nr:hypothetical protein LYNGBM3L_07520 [Moorena producens 3L]NER89668.1 hypothetical protein [Moorena sp. SIO3A2]OLT65734.1 hypothetical protein BI334_12415 [Moorena producens 3L]